MGERSDFNDLHVEQGLAVVKRQLDDALGCLKKKRANSPSRESVVSRPYDYYPELPPEQLRTDPETQWQEQFLKTDTQKIKVDPFNALLVLQYDPRWKGVLGFSDFSYRIYKRKLPPYAGAQLGEWTDSDLFRLRAWYSQHYGFSPRDADAMGAVLTVAEDNHFHEVRDYFGGLVWDGKYRLWQWLHTYMGATGEGDRGIYNQRVGVFWLVGAVARIMRPPVKVDNVLIFEGLQGLGKSTALNILAGDWFTDSTVNLGDKDTYQLMQGVLIIELGELDAFNKAESTRAKTFFSSQSDRFRPPYGRVPKEYPRQCIFAGSTNMDSYFKDATGNRRYWPVKCTHVDAEKLTRDRDQLWAEAIHWYNEGHTWWPEDEDLHLFTAEQEERFDVDVWQEKIEKYLRGLTADRVQMSDVMEDALKMPIGNWKPPEQNRVGKIMKHLGWEKARIRIGNSREHYYKKPDDWEHDSDSDDEGELDLIL